MSVRLSFNDIRTGFDRPFWIANISEIFERLSYYAIFASLAVYLNQNLGFPTEKAAALTSDFGGWVWVMAVFGGTLADRIGFRRALSAAYFILTIAYFLAGSISAPWLSFARSAVPLEWLVGILLFLPALGVALVKPSVVGTTARASTEKVRGIGYSIYYTMVNIGSFFGPLLAGWLHDHLPPQAVFLIAAASVFMMFLMVLAFFREPRGEAAVETPSFAQTLRNFGTVLSNWRFVLFLVIFSGYWMVYWQQYSILPLYITQHINKLANTDYILATDPLIVITLTVVMSTVTRRLSSFNAIIFGTLITSLSWLFIAAQGSIAMAVLSLAVLALGEIIQSPRYYEYASRLAPAGQQGTYMGFAFLPIGIGSFCSGHFIGPLLQHVQTSGGAANVVWFVVVGIGLATTLLLFLYDRLIARTTPA